MQATMVMFRADGTRRDFPLPKARSVIGRVSSCDLRIPLSAVSRNHCEIHAERGTMKLRDLNSSNGTFHNGTRVRREVSLNPGDRIQIGPVLFTLVIDGVPAKLEPSDTLMAADVQVKAGIEAEKAKKGKKGAEAPPRKSKVKREAGEQPAAAAEEDSAPVDEAKKPKTDPTRTAEPADKESIPVLDDDQDAGPPRESTKKATAAAADDEPGSLDDIDLEDPIAALEAMASGDSGNDLSWLSDASDDAEAEKSN